MKIYSEPKLKEYPDSNKGWYVWFRYKGTLIKKTGEINRIACHKERRRSGQALAKFISQQLKSGWNPLVPGLDEIEGAALTLYQAFEFSLEKKINIQPKTLSGYRTTVKYCKGAISELNLNYLPVRDVKRVHIKTIIEKMQKSLSMSAKSYNKHLNHIHAMLSELIQWDVIEKNPADHIKRLQVMDTRANIPPTAR